MSTTPFHTNPVGISHAIDAEAKGLDPLQLYREFFQNGAEAGATKVWFDYWEDPTTGHKLMRITDNGSGMTMDEMRRHLGTLYSTGGSYDVNYGIGAKISSLPFNHSGVSFISRTPSDGDIMMTLHRDRDVYGVKNFDAVDGDGYKVSTAIVIPEARELGRLPKSATSGTAVILHGDGQSDTWSSSLAYRIAKFLGDRYYEFPGGAVPVVKFNEGGSAPKLTGFGTRLADQAISDGEVPFHDVNGLNGTIYWWILPETKSYDATGTKRTSTSMVGGGVGVVVHDEVFQYRQNYSMDFGLVFRKVQQRVAILVSVDGALMDTGRGSIIVPGYQKNIPWKRFGAWFVEHMPTPIDELLHAASPIRAEGLDEALARMLDEDWVKKLQPTPTIVPADEGDDTTGTGDGDASPPDGLTPNPERATSTGNSATTRAALKRAAGDRPAKKLPKVNLPDVVFVDPDDEGPGVDQSWVTFAVNTIKIWTDAPPYMRDLGRWLAATPTVPPALVEQAVRQAYAAELASLIIDANGQARYGADEDFVEQLKSPPALYAKLLGVQAIETKIADSIKTLMRLADAIE